MPLQHGFFTYRANAQLLALQKNNMKLDLSHKTVQIAVLMALALIWGSSFILMKRGLETFDALQVGAFRMFLSALFFLPLTLRHLHVLRNLKILRSLVIAALLGNFFPAFLFTFAQTHISSSLAGMLNALTPFWALAIGLLVYKAKVRWWNVLGILLGLVGAIGLIVAGPNFTLHGEWHYALLVVLATLFYGINVNEIKHKLVDLKPVAVASLALSIAGALGGIYLLFSDFSAAAQSPVLWQSFGYIVVLSLVGTTLALIAFNTLIKYTTAIYASSVTYVIPIFAIFWGLLDGEVLALGQFLFMAVILTGVYLVNKQ